MSRGSALSDTHVRVDSSDARLVSRLVHSELHPVRFRRVLRPIGNLHHFDAVHKNARLISIGSGSPLDPPTVSLGRLPVEEVVTGIALVSFRNEAEPHVRWVVPGIELPNLPP